MECIVGRRSQERKKRVLEVPGQPGHPLPCWRALWSLALLIVVRLTKAVYYVRLMVFLTSKKKFNFIQGYHQLMPIVRGGGQVIHWPAREDVSMPMIQGVI